MSAKNKVSKSAAKPAAKPAVKTATKNAKVAPFKKGDVVVFKGWNGAAPDDTEDIKKGLVGKVRSVSANEIEVALETADGTAIVPFGPTEIAIASKADIAKATKLLEVDDDADEDADTDTDEDADEEAGPTEGNLADEGDKKAIKSLTAKCKKAGIDPDNYETWAEAEAALTDDSDEDEEEEEEDEDEKPSKSKGKVKAQAAKRAKVEEEEEEEEEDEGTDETYEDMDTSALRELCVERGLSKSGNKEKLIERLTEDDEAGDEEEDEDEDEAPAKPKREPSLGRKADEGDKPAVKELTKRCKAVDLDPDDYQTWTEVERELKVAEKEAARPALKVTKEVQAELGEDDEDAITAAKRLIETAEKTYYTLGGVLAVIDRKKLYEGVKIKGEFPYQGMEGFKSFCEEHLGVAYRKAKYLIAIYEAFTQAGLTAAKISSVGSWSKAKELVSILQAEPDQAEKWIEIAKTKPLGQVQEAVKARLTKIGAKVHGNTKSGTARTVTCKFTVHEDEGKVVEEALAKAKELADTESDSEAFAYIVKEWMTFQG